MANLINNQITYTVKNNGEWFYKSLQKAHTLANDYIRVIPNVTKDVKIHKLVMQNTISQKDERDCAWNPTQRITLNEATFQVKNWKINEEQCMEELDSIWSEMQYRQIGATKDEWPASTDGSESLESAVMFHVQNSLANDIERIIWGGTGNKVGGQNTDGIVDKALASATSIKITGQTIDATNVLGEIEKVYNAIPNVVLNDGEFDPEKAAVKIFVNMDIMRYLRQALSTVATSQQVILPSFAVEGGKIYYLGVEIVVVGLPANTMIAASKDNLVFVTDLLSDTQEIRAQFGNDLKDESTLFIKGAYRANAGMIFDDELVIYHA